MPAGQSELLLEVDELKLTKLSVFTRFIADTLTFEAVAYADIKEGEELTLSCEFN